MTSRTMTKIQAQVTYRAAWAARCLANNDEARRAAEQAMDAVQVFCVDGGRPGAEWDAFIDTLPGYRAHWAGMEIECANMIEAMVKRGAR